MFSCRMISFAAETLSGSSTSENRSAFGRSPEVSTAYHALSWNITATANSGGGTSNRRALI